MHRALYSPHGPDESSQGTQCTAVEDLYPSHGGCPCTKVGLRKRGHLRDAGANSQAIAEMLYVDLLVDLCASFVVIVDE